VAFRVTLQRSAETLRAIILNILQVQQMQIQSLRIKSDKLSSYRSCLDDELYNALSASPLAKSLTNMSIDYNSIDEPQDSTDLQNLELSVQENQKIRQKPMDIERRQIVIMKRNHFASFHAGAKEVLL